MKNHKHSTPKYPIEGLDRALRLLSLFRDEQELRLSHVREYLGVGQSTAHRLMAMLVYRGFAVQDLKTRIYRPGPELLTIGASISRNLENLRTAVQPVLKSLATASEETVHLGTLEGGDVRYLDCIESQTMLRVGGRVGRLSPAYASSLGKAMLSLLSDEVVTTLFPSPALPKITNRTNTKRSALLKELEGVREQGFAHNLEEVENGVASVAVAIEPYSRRQVFALSVAFPISRSSNSRITEYVDLLISAAARLAPLI